jgi:hypothetical protein
MAKRRKKATAAEHAAIAAADARADQARAEMEKWLLTHGPKLRDWLKQASEEHEAAQEARRALDEAGVIDVRIVAPRRKKRKAAAKGKPGRKPKYDKAAITRVGKETFSPKHASFAAFCRAASNRLIELGIDEPGQTRFEELLRPIYRAAKGR